MLRLCDLSKSYGDRTLLDSISLNVPQGEKVALVGQNGCGKSTLLGIICGELAPDGGEVAFPKGFRLGYLPQEPNPTPLPTVLAEAEAGAEQLAALKVQLTETLEALANEHSAALLRRHEEAESAFRLAGGYGLTAKASGILAGLGFAPEQWQQDPRALSGGWRMRLELAKIFLKEPDLLILDEPTNHLDLPSLVWVESWLQQFTGTVLFVSHDRGLLNRLAVCTLHLHHGDLRLYRGNFDRFLEQKAEHESQVASQKANLERRREEHERFVARFGAKASKARQAQSRVKMIARLRSLEDELAGPQVDQVMALRLPEPPACSRQVLTLTDLAIGYQADRPLANGINFNLEKGQKVAVIGANGIGKSTLIKTIAGELPPINGAVTGGHGVRAGYFAQDQGAKLDLNATVLANVLAAAATVTEKSARQLLGGLLFREDEVFKQAQVLSGGEKNRLGLACLLAQNANLLLLDEPTNHLDMASVEVLIDALDGYPGTLLFVSHDRAFIDALATHVLVMLADGRHELFLGNLDDYQTLAPQRGFPNVLSQAPVLEGAAPNAGSHSGAGASEGRQQNQDAKELKRSRQRIQKQIAATEAEQAEAHTTLTQLEAAAVALDPSDFAAAQELLQRSDDARQTLAAAEDRWLELQEQLEQVEAALNAMGRLA